MVDLEIDESKCIACGKCNETCEMHLPEIIDDKAKDYFAKMHVLSLLSKHLPHRCN
jgi:ferredoxin